MCVGGTLVQVRVGGCVWVYEVGGSFLIFYLRGGAGFWSTPVVVHCICTMEAFLRSILLSRTQSDFYSLNYDGFVLFSKVFEGAGSLGDTE